MVERPQCTVSERGGDELKDFLGSVDVQRENVTQRTFQICVIKQANLIPRKMTHGSKGHL